MSSQSPPSPESSAPEPPPAQAKPSSDPDQGSSPRGRRPDYRVVRVHRIGAIVVALVIATFGVLGFVGGLGFFDTQGAPVAGLSTNGLLSTISVVTALVLIFAAVRGGRLASTIMIVVGVLFLVSAFVNLGLMNTEFNILAFRLPNVFFSIGAGLVLLFVGSYGRVSSKLPDDNPYKLEKAEREAASGNPSADEEPERTFTGPPNAREQRADYEMAEAARALANGAATDAQRDRLVRIDSLRTHEDRRDRWMAIDREEAEESEGRESDPRRGSALA